MAINIGPNQPHILNTSSRSGDQNFESKQALSTKSPSIPQEQQSKTPSNLNDIDVSSLKFSEVYPPGTKSFVGNNRIIIMDNSELGDRMENILKRTSGDQGKILIDMRVTIPRQSRGL
ncbi:hypothetical protein [Thiorhodococcus fuscus]|uniref:Uncharacterized protein n=1 Tax=Thiorhodococcus fuscus TaxID=527200 RepID=A0ABW4YDI5_9GAMM